MSNNSAQMVIIGLNSAQTSVQAGQVLVSVKTRCRTLSQGNTANSQVVTTVNQNGSPVYTSIPGAEGFQITLNCAANDIIAVALTSSDSNDGALNTTKSVISIG